MVTAVLSASRAGLGSVIVADPTLIRIQPISNIGIYDPGFIRAPAIGNMDGVASVSTVGRTINPISAQMNGQAAMQAPSAVLHTGTAEMDGAASIYVTGLALVSGYANMDGWVDVQWASANLATGFAQMDGTASDVVMQSVDGAGLAEMAGQASMLAKSPNRYNLYLQDNVVGGHATKILMTYKSRMSQNMITSELSKVRMRYHILQQSNISLALAGVSKMQFLKALTDVTITLTDNLLAPHSRFHYVLTSGFNVLPTVPIPTWNGILSLVQNFTVHVATTPKFIWGRILAQAFKVSATATAIGKYKTALAQLFKLSDVDGFSHTIPLVLSQAIHVSLSLAARSSLKLLQNILVASSASPVFRYHFTLAGRIVVGDIANHFRTAILAQLFNIHPTLSRQFIANNSLAQLLTVHPALNNKLILEIAEVGNLQLSSSELVHMIYKGDPLLDEVVITALYISPSGTTTTWAVNTRTNAVTEYTNYDFRSFAMMGNRYIAAGTDGLYELDGDTDDGVTIISELMSGYLQLNEKKLFGIKGAYVAIRGGGRFYLKLIAGDGREYIYELKAQPNLMTTKVKVGKGIRTTYMAFDLVTEGQDFDLDSIEFIPMTSGRRV